jgi:ADP-ribosylglycohydrolase
MNLSDKPRAEWTDADHQANCTANTLKRRAKKLRDVANRVDKYAERIRNSGSARRPMSDIRLPHAAVNAMAEAIQSVTNGVDMMGLHDLVVEAADVDARYAAEKSAGGE